MTSTIGIILFSGALFLLIILNLAAKPKFAGTLSRIFLVVSAIVGLYFYGYGFAKTIDRPSLAIVRTVTAVCFMFAGRNEFASISSLDIFQNSDVVICFWVIHFLAFYVTASAAITVVGSEALKKIRLALSRKGDLIIIYGTNDDALQFGKEYATTKGTSVVFVDDTLSANAAQTISEMGVVALTDDKATQADEALFKSLYVKPGNKRVTICCFKTDEVDNISYAKKTIQTFKDMKISPEQTTLILCGEKESLANELQAYKEQYGFGNVYIFNMTDQAVRQMIEICPPYEQIKFDKECKATENFECLIYGFGRHGQSVLKQLIMNGQFYGSHFKCAIISPDCEKVQGYIRSECPDIFNQYDITLLPYDARSYDAFAYINENKSTLKYIVNTISGESTKAEVTQQICMKLEKENIHIPVIQISNHEVVAHIPNQGNAIKMNLLTKKSVDYKTIHLMAMVLNNKYSSNCKNPIWDDWKQCDYFSRLSSKASADFIPAYLKIMNKKQRDVENMNELKLTPIQKENLGRTEHLRWMAFHYCMGWMKMSDQEWEERAKQYLEEKKTMDKPKTRIGKNANAHTHACLVPWEDLELVSAKESEVTQKNVDFQQYDVDNVLLIPEILKILSQTQTRI